MTASRSGGLKRAVYLSTGLHVTLIAAAWALTLNREVMPPMRVYAVNIVSPPPQEAGPPEAGVAEPEPAEPEPEPEVVEPEPEPTPAPPPPPPPSAPQRTVSPPPPAAPPRQAEQAREPAPQQPRQAEARPSTGANPDPASAGGDNINLRLQGVQCPTPDYCENIIRQINRYFRYSGNGEAEVFFQINRDGSIADLRLLSSSGGATFRFAVLEAVEQAGRNEAFGALPREYQADRLPVSFYFRPPR